MPATASGSGGARPDELRERLARSAGVSIADAAVAVLAAASSELEGDELTAQLLWIARACESGQADSGANGQTVVRRRRLIDRLRAELVNQWQRRPEAPEAMVGALARLERAHAACAAAGDQSFAAELSDGGALDLVVEIAHDMRSPLTSIQFLAEVLHAGQSGPLNDVQRRQVGIIYSAALGLAGMASDVMDMATGRKPPITQAIPFSVEDVVQTVQNLVRPMAEEKGVELTVECAISGARLGFPIALSRVLLNLTTNALKFTHEGLVELTVRPGERGEEFAVRDTGPGMAPEAVETLFQPFRRVTTRETGYTFSGTGLGLSICRQLVGGMGGELHIDTAPQHGTRFSFEIELPRAAPA